VTKSRRRLGWLAVALLFAAAIWTDGETTTAAKWALTAVDTCGFLIACDLTETIP
jgi:hypothetical protein